MKYLRKVYDLTVEQMERVFREVQRAYYIEDIVDYIIEGEIIDERELYKVDLDYIVDKYISRMEAGIGQIYVLEDTINEYFENNKHKFGTLDMTRL